MRLHIKVVRDAVEEVAGPAVRLSEQAELPGA